MHLPDRVPYQEESMQYRDRTEAGQLLGIVLFGSARRPDTLVLGLPRGGVPVAAAIARVLGAPLDVLVVRKLGVPGREELAFGAVAWGGAPLLNPAIIEGFALSSKVVAAVTRREAHAVRRLAQRYRGDRPAPTLRGRTVILVDDGIATGASMRAAIAVARVQQPRRLVVAVPVAPQEVYEQMQREVDDVVCLQRPVCFGSVGQWYTDFAPVTNGEVARALGQGDGEHP
jgi:putative phosphoribosyl transferase